MVLASVTLLTAFARAQDAAVHRDQITAANSRALENLRQQVSAEAIGQGVTVADLLYMGDVTVYKVATPGGARVEALKVALRALLKELKASGASIAAYGASAKGSTLLNYPAMYAGALAMAILGLILYFAVDGLERWLCPWRFTS